MIITLACKIMLKDNYSTYDSALQQLSLQNLSERRKNLCLRFAQNCLNHEKTKGMLPLKTPGSYALRNFEKYQVNFASTDRLLKSSIPMMQRMLNEN